MNCKFEAKAGSKQELMKLIGEHAKTAHKMNQIDPAMVAKIDKAIKP